MNVSFWSAVPEDDGKHLGSWYTDTNEDLPRIPQVPREGEIVWLETRDIKLARFRVHHVEWSFKQYYSSERDSIPMPSIGCEVYVEPYPRSDAALEREEKK